MDQRTDEWYRERLGRVTASRLADVMARTKSGFSVSRENYLNELVIERLTGSKADGFSNAAMEWGVQYEPEARTFYQLVTDQMVTEVGFVRHPYIDNFGASPDGLVGENGLVEIKCPNTKTHIDTLLTGKIAKKYILQMHAQMICTQREWCDFVSYDPRVPDHLQLYIQRINRDDELVELIESEVQDFLDEVTVRLIALDAVEINHAQSRLH